MLVTMTLSLGAFQEAIQPGERPEFALETRTSRGFSATHQSGRFIENQGQWKTPARYVYRSNNLLARLEQGAFLLQLTKPTPAKPTTGEPVAAVFGYANSLLTVLNELKPTHVAVVSTGPGVS